jgi:predicted nucleic acid-binding protein
MKRRRAALRMGRLFLDTNIYLAALKEEKYEASLLFERALGCEFYIVYCERIAMEIENKFPELEADMIDLKEKLLSKNKLILITENSSDKRDALRLMRDLKIQQAFLGLEDCLFGVLAKRHKCILVSEDKKLVESLRNYKFNARKLSFLFPEHGD